MRAHSLVLAAASVILVGAVPAEAVTVIENGSFESGMADWVLKYNGGTIQAVTHHDGVAPSGYTDPMSWDPTHGDYFALLCAGDRNKLVSIRQSFSLAEPGQLCFDWFFDSGQGECQLLRYDDTAGGALDEEVLFKIKASCLPDPWGATPWRSECIALAPGSYTLKFGVKNVRDDNNDSYLGIDRVRVRVIPEPLTALAVGAALCGLAAYIHRRRLA